MNLKKSMLVTAVAAAVSTAAIADPMTLRVQTHYATEHPTGQMLAIWADDVQTMSGGEITVEMFYSSSVVQRLKLLMLPSTVSSTVTRPVALTRRVKTQRSSSLVTLWVVTIPHGSSTHGCTTATATQLHRNCTTLRTCS